MKKLYNILFPIWFLFLIPSWFLLLIIPGNFAIDSLAIYIISKIKKYNYKEVWKNSIIKIWAIGFISDILGSIFLILLMLLLEQIKININWLTFPGATLSAIPGVVVAGICIYFINKRYSFNKTSLKANQVKEISLLFAIMTAPYMMLIPLYF